jgi:hypothetical protein
MFQNVDTLYLIMEEEGRCNLHHHCITWCLVYFLLQKGHKFSAAWNDTYQGCDGVTDKKYFTNNHLETGLVLKCSESLLKKNACMTQAIFYHIWKNNHHQKTTIYKNNLVLALEIGRVWQNNNHCKM